MKKKGLTKKERKKRIIYVIIVIVFYTTVLGTFTWASYNKGYYDNEQHNSLELSWIRNQLLSCYEEVEEYVPHCENPIECMTDGTIIGCYRDNCNWCCYDVCTLNKCAYYDDKINLPDNLTLLIPEHINIPEYKI